MMKRQKWLLLTLVLVMVVTVGGGAQAANRYSMTRAEMDAITNPVDALRDSGASYDEWYGAARAARAALVEANRAPRNYGDIGGDFTKALNRTFNWGGFAEGTYLLPQYLLGTGPSWILGYAAKDTETEEPESVLSPAEEDAIKSLIDDVIGSADDDSKALAAFYKELLLAYFEQAPQVGVTDYLVRELIEAIEATGLADTAEKRAVILAEIKLKEPAESEDSDEIIGFDQLNIVRSIDLLRTKSPEGDASSPEDRMLGNFTPAEQEFLDRYTGMNRLYLELYLMKNPNTKITNIALEALVNAYHMSDDYTNQTEETLFDEREALRAQNEGMSAEELAQLSVTEAAWDEMLSALLVNNPGLNLFGEDAQGIRNPVYGITYEDGTTNTELMHINHQIIIGALSYMGVVSEEYSGVILGVDSDGNAVMRVIPKGATNVTVGEDEYAIIWGEVDRITVTGNGIVQTAAGAIIGKIEVNGSGSLEVNGGTIGQVSLWYNSGMRVYDTTAVGKIFLGGNATLQYPKADDAKDTKIFAQKPRNVSALDSETITVHSDFYTSKAPPRPLPVITEEEETTEGINDDFEDNANQSNQTPTVVCSNPSCSCSCNPYASVPSDCICDAGVCGCSCDYYQPPTSCSGGCGCVDSSVCSCSECPNFSPQPVP